MSTHFFPLPNKIFEKLQLQKFKKKSGKANVPHGTNPDEGIGSWGWGAGRGIPMGMPRALDRALHDLCQWGLFITRHPRRVLSSSFFFK